MGNGYGKDELPELAIKRELERKVNYCAACVRFSL